MKLKLLVIWSLRKQDLKIQIHRLILDSIIDLLSFPEKNDVLAFLSSSNVKKLINCL